MNYPSISSLNRDKASAAVLGRDSLRISEATQLNENDIDFQKGVLTIVHLKERLKLKWQTAGIF